MKLDLYDKYELAPENEDIYNFIRKHGRLLYEVADWLDMGVVDFYVWLGEPLSNSDKRTIAKAVKELFDYDYAKMREHTMTPEERKEQRKHDEAKYGKTVKCALNDGRKYTGQFRNYETGVNQWDG